MLDFEDGWGVQLPAAEVEVWPEETFELLAAKESDEWSTSLILNIFFQLQLYFRISSWKTLD